MIMEDLFKFEQGKSEQHEQIEALLKKYARRERWKRGVKLRDVLGLKEKRTLFQKEKIEIIQCTGEEITDAVIINIVRNVQKKGQCDGIVAEETCIFIDPDSVYSINGKRIAWGGYWTEYGSGNVTFSRELEPILSAAGIDTRRFSFFDTGVRILDLEEGKKFSAEARQAAADTRRNDRLRRASEKKKVHTIGVMGEFKRGITTLTNAFLEADLLPTNILPTTAMITTVKYGAKVEACLIGNDGKTEGIPIEDLPEYICSEQGESPDSADYREVIVCFPSEFLKNGVEIVDTPGLNNSEELNEISESSIPRFDMVLMVINVSPFGWFAKEFIPKLLERVGLQQIVFVVNKIDLIEAEDRELAEKYIKESIGLLIEDTAKPYLAEIYGEEEAEQICSGDINLFFVSAKRALKGEEPYRDGILQLKETLTALLKSGD